MKSLYKIANEYYYDNSVRPTYKNRVNMTEQYIDEISKLRSEGKKTSEIAKILNIQANTLRAYFYHHRDIFPKLGRYRHIEELESREMHKEFYVDGMTKKAISIKHNVGVGTVKRHIDMIDFMNTLNSER